MVFLESICPEPTLFLFGGGHVSFAIAQIAHSVGFRIVVIDDRPMFANKERFPMASETLTLEMETAFDHLIVDDLSYVVAVTRGHQHDKPVIEQAIDTQAAYVGMIGSRRKIALMWKEFEAKGISRENWMLFTRRLDWISRRYTRRNRREYCVRTHSSAPITGKTRSSGYVAVNGVISKCFIVGGE